MYFKVLFSYLQVYLDYKVVGQMRKLPSEIYCLIIKTHLSWEQVQS